MEEKLAINKAIQADFNISKEQIMCWVRTPILTGS